MIKWIDEAFFNWDKIIRENCILSDDILIVHVAEDTSFLSTLLEVSKKMHYAGICRHVYVLGAKESDIDVPEECTEAIRPIQCEDVILKRIAVLYCIVPFSDRLFFDSYAMSADSDLMKLRGVNGISDEEMACIAVYNRPELLNLYMGPDKRKIPVASFVDWEKLNFRKCYNGSNSYEEIVERLKEKELNKDCEIVIFTTTLTAKKVRGLLEGYNVTAFIDNDPKLEGMEIDGIRIHTPDYLKKKKEGFRILVASRHYRVICEQLNAMGYETGEQVFPVHDAVLNEMTYATVRESTKEKIRRGEKIYLSLRQEHKAGEIYINPHTGTGDVYFSWLYTDMQKAILLVPTENCRKLANLLGICSKCMPVDDLSALVAYGRYIGMEDTGIKVLNYSFDQFVTARIRGYKELDYNSMLQIAVFETEKRAVSKRIPQKSSDAIFVRSGLEKGRTVLISPYAGHAEDIPDFFWRRIAGHLKNMGYDVCTNVNGEERAIEGTLGLSLDYAEVLDFCDKAGIFIGLRSGLCDLLSTTIAKMIVIYPDQLFSKVVDYYHYFSLERMGMRMDNLLELIWDNKDTDRYIEEIDRFIC